MARRLSAIVASFPPVPAGLERRVQEIVRLRPVAPASRRGWRWAPTTSTLGTAAVSALATALVFLAVLICFPAASGGQRSWAQMIDVLLGQTRVRVTPTLQAGSTFVSQTVDVASLTPVAGGALAEPGLPRRELLRDLVAAELLIGRAPSTPKTLPQGLCPARDLGCFLSRFAFLDIAALLRRALLRGRDGGIVAGSAPATVPALVPRAGWNQRRASGQRRGPGHGTGRRWGGDGHAADP